MGLDPHNLARFLTAQNANGTYQKALAEMKRGRKRSHWMWFIFPMFTGLAVSATSKFFVNQSIDEARAYLEHPVLGPRLLEISQAVLESNTATPLALMGPPDHIKLLSCMTLFNLASYQLVFLEVIEKYYAGRDQATVDIWNRFASA